MDFSWVEWIEVYIWDTQALWVSRESARLLVWHVNYPIFKKAQLDSGSLRRRSTHSHNLELIWLRRGHSRTERRKVDWGFQITGYAPRLISFFSLLWTLRWWPFHMKNLLQKNMSGENHTVWHISWGLMINKNDPKFKDNETKSNSALLKL